jgi:hypothetical protein
MYVVPIALVPDVPAVLLDVVPAVLVVDDDGVSVFFAFVNMNAVPEVADVVLLAVELAEPEPSFRHPVAVIVSALCCDVLVLVVGSCAPAATAPTKTTAATPLSQAVFFMRVSSDAAVCKPCSPTAQAAMRSTASATGISASTGRPKTLLRGWFQDAEQDSHGTDKW